MIRQVGKVVKSLSNILGFRSSCFTSQSDFNHEDRRLRIGVEVLVTTPGRLLELIKKNDVYLKDLQTLVLDETDILYMDESFPLPEIASYLPLSSTNSTLNTHSDTSINARDRDVQYLFISATLPKEVVSQISKEFPTVEVLYGPGLHRIIPTVEEELIDCSVRPNQRMTKDTVLENKLEALKRVIIRTQRASTAASGIGGVVGFENVRRSTSRSEISSWTMVDRTIIYCNTIEQCRNVENYLKKENRRGGLFDVFPYHSAIDIKLREHHLFQFTKALLRKPAILICTDRTSRGLDFNKAVVSALPQFPLSRC